jgi:hypothetical protein
VSETGATGPGWGITARDLHDGFQVGTTEEIDAPWS